MDPLRICLWSGPRNVSTALMYSFAERPDTRVVDEPLYAHYLRVSAARHPLREEVLAAYETDGQKAVRGVVLGPCDRPVLFLKQMAHHLVDLDLGFLEQTKNILLIRHPSEVLSSLVRQLPEPQLADTGIAIQCDLLRQLQEMGQEPPVIDSRELLRDPAGVLEQLCARLEIPFMKAMMSWNAGPRREDGLWAPHWYENVHRSTGFMPYRPKTQAFPEKLQPLLEECRPYYDRLFAEAIRATV
ncbi:MAG: sulfotransferase family protein [Acidobacteriota bacterium]|nr:sulfotransferase family protein [Acidobacteriota bacterium]